MSSAPPEFWDALARAKVTLGRGASLPELESAAAMLESARHLARTRPHALSILDGLAQELQQAIAALTRGSGTQMKAGVVPQLVKKSS